MRDTPPHGPPLTPAEQQLLRSLIESSDDAIISKTLQGIITSWNAGAEKLFGYTRAEALGKHMLMLFPPERVKEEDEILGRIRRGESVDHFETVRVRKDGTRVNVSVTISPIRDNQGNILGASKIARDITERKRAEAKERAQLGRLELLHRITRAIGERQDTHSIFQVVVRTVEAELPLDFCCIALHEPADHQLVVASVGMADSSLAQDLGLTSQAQIPTDANGLSRCLRGECVYEPDISLIPLPFPQRLARGGLRSLVAAPLRVESQVFGVLIAARRAPRGFTSGDCEFLNQLSEHVALAAHQAQLYGALQKAYDDLRQTQQAVLQQERLSALGQMASGIAHDINNAISPAMLYTQKLLETEPGLTRVGRDSLETIQRAIDDVAQTVTLMREFYRPREPLSTQGPVNLNGLVRQVIELTRARWSDMAHQRNIVIEVQPDLAADLPAIKGAESEIREALTNLIFNAVDAMPAGGRLTLKTQALGTQHIELEITDTGVGMEEEARRRCFEPFFTTKGERGTGLGLAMVHGVVQRHNAEIDLASAPNRGTTFRLRFPTPPAAAAAPAPVLARESNVSALRILLIDDDPLVLRSLEHILASEGHNLTVAPGGQEGIDAFRTLHEKGPPFDLVMTDLGMPYVDGRKVASAIKQLAPTIPIILLTGWGQRMAAEGDIPAHVDRVLSKPPRLRELREALTALIQ